MSNCPDQPSKPCIRCGERRPISDFYAHPMMADGRLNKCKRCCRNDATANRNNNLERIRQYDRDRYRNPDRRANVFQRNRMYGLATPKHVLSARAAVGNALRSGKLKRQPCVVCGKPRTDAHHPDYAKPLEVVWLCRPHHLQWHAKHGPGMNRHDEPMMTT